jgi:hypothetical protein
MGRIGLIGQIGFTIAERDLVQMTDAGRSATLEGSAQNILVIQG